MCKIITEEEFDSKFTPIENKIETNAAFNGTMFETYGPEWEYVKEQPINNVWTIVSTEDDGMAYLSGFHAINRMGYFITKEKWIEETEVTLDVETDE
jgi:hypothetical protein